MGYDAWGQVRVRGDLQTDIGHTAQREDVGINVMFYNARYYSPYLNRWLSPDTIVPDPKNPQSLNRYSYVNNRPLNFTDSTGHYSEAELIAMGVVNGPNMLQQMKEDPNSVTWYWLLRAASDGDNLYLETSEWHGVYIGGMGDFSGQLVASDNGLMLKGADGIAYGVKWYGLADLADSNHGYNQFGHAQLTKTSGTVLDNANNARRFVQQQQHKYRNIDYGGVAVGAYAGPGGGIALKVDRYGHVYFTVSVGIGLGGKGGSDSMGAYNTDYVPDETELQGYMTGLSMSLNVSAVAEVAGSQPAEGPPAGEFGSGFPGVSLSLDYTFLIR